MLDAATPACQRRCARDPPARQRQPRRAAVVATIVSIACDIAQQGIAEPGDIDRAVTLGLGYPQGPLAWGDDLGAATVLSRC